MRKRKLKRITIPGILNHIVIAILAILCALPMILVFAISITSSGAIRMDGYQLIPSEFSFEAYRMIFSTNSSIYQGYFISTIVTVVGTFIAITITGMAAFTLQNKNVRYRNALAFYFFIPMVFNAGLVPWFMMNRALGLQNNIWALIVPSLLFSSFNMFLCRNFMRGIPDSLMESAKLDGATEITIAFRIYFPLSTPVLATVALFYAVAYWNDWFNAIMLVNDHNLYPLQYMLHQIQSELESLRRLGPGIAARNLPGEAMRMATVIVTIGPIVLLYPYLQKYFVKGLIIGGVKG